MLQRTFLHVPGLGAHTERSLWSQGCVTWEHYLREPESYNTGGCDRVRLEQTVRNSKTALMERRHQYFADALGAREAWRAWPEFRKSCLYLDIETDGGQSGDSVTCIGLYDGTAFRCLVQGEDLALFPDIVSHYGMIVTFFGSGFDVPMLRRAFPHVHFDQIHVDLCPTLKRLGFRGGLKKIEKQLGIGRSDETDGLSGMDAVRLWREYQRGRTASLDTLIQYNQEDVVNLERLAEIAYARLNRQTLTEAGCAHLLEGQECLF
ncbi:MAG: ribonuclease H-like domain-containing protein [Armatimonadetes bacterium]|nr:ribonuclease H-like domain-containing protein [Armatimonadota bacterium]